MPATGVAGELEEAACTAMAIGRSGDVETFIAAQEASSVLAQNPASITLTRSGSAWWDG